MERDETMRAMNILSAIALVASAASAPAYAAGTSNHAIATPAKASANVKKGEDAFHITPILIIVALAAIGGVILLATDNSKSP